MKKSFCVTKVSVSFAETGSSRSFSGMGNDISLGVVDDVFKSNSLPELKSRCLNFSRGYSVSEIHNCLPVVGNKQVNFISEKESLLIGGK